MPCLLILGAIPALGQQIAGGSVARLRETPAYQHAAIAGAYKTAAWLNEKCEGTGATISKGLTVVSMPVVVDARMQPQSGGKRLMPYEASAKAGQKNPKGSPSIRSSKCRD